MGVTGDNSKAISGIISALVQFLEETLFLYSHIATDNCDSSTSRTFVYRFILAPNFEDKMERESTDNAEKTQPASSLLGNMNEDTCVANSPSSPVGTCGNTDVARARWTLLRQVYSRKHALSLKLSLFYAIFLNAFSAC